MDALNIKMAKYRFLSRHLAATTGPATEGLLAVALETERLGRELLAELAVSES